jgi:hypothetical protein
VRENPAEPFWPGQARQLHERLRSRKELTASADGLDWLGRVLDA